MFGRLPMKDQKKHKGKFNRKYRLVVLDETTFEEKLTIRLTRLNVFLFGGIFSLLLIVGTLFLIAFTPLKEYIPGYESSALRKQASALVYKADSLEKSVAVHQLYVQQIRQLLTGEIPEVDFDKEAALQAAQQAVDSLEMDPSETDLEFRQEVEVADRYSIFSEAVKSIGVVFFKPVEGVLTAGYDLEQKHFAVDIAVEMGTPVKAVAEGTVIFAEWTAQTGHVVIIKHAGGFISVYKHNTSLHKKQGDLVQSGEVIASAGNTGALSTGPHLHFELWNDGYPVDPSNYIDFE